MQHDSVGTHVEPDLEININNRHNLNEEEFAIYEQPRGIKRIDQVKNTKRSLKIA